MRWLAALILRRLTSGAASYLYSLLVSGSSLRAAAARSSVALPVSRPRLSDATRQMAEPRKVPFVTISSFSTSPPTQESNKKRRREDEAIDVTFGKDGGGGAAAVGSGGGGGLFSNAKGGDAETVEGKPTVRLNLQLSEPNERGSSEFNYGELVHPTPPQVRDGKHDVNRGHLLRLAGGGQVSARAAVTSLSTGAQNFCSVFIHLL